MSKTGKSWKGKLYDEVWRRILLQKKSDTIQTARGMCSCGVQISVVIPEKFNETAWEKQLKESLKEQSYVRWEILDGNKAKALKNTEDYVMCIRPGIVLKKDALYEIVKEILKNKPDCLYSDYERMGEDGVSCAPMCLPGWSPDLLKSQMYIGAMLCVRREIYQQVLGANEQFSGELVQEFAYKMMEQAGKISHLEQRLYQVVKQTEEREALSEGYIWRDIRYPLKETPKVSVIVPVHDLEKEAVEVAEHIKRQTEYENYEVITPQWKVSGDSLAELFNQGMEQAEGDVFVFLNENMETYTADWLQRLAENAQRQEIGAVGGMILYKNGTICHGGMVIGMQGFCDSLFRGMKPEEKESPFVSPLVARNVMAVTGCVAISRDKMGQMGKFREQLGDFGSDVEWCLQAYEKGLRNLYIPYVKMCCKKEKDSATYIPETAFREYAKVCSPYVGKDPYYNSQLDLQETRPTLKALYMEEVKNGELLEYVIPEAGPYSFRRVSYPRKRMNLLVPSINTEHVFGGISTALKFFDRLSEALGYDKRIILIDAAPDEDAVSRYSGEYTCVTCQDNSEEKNQIVSYVDRYREGNSLPVSENDYFMFTSWWTAYCTQEAYKRFESKQGIAPHTFCYFVQDYEPGFYPWSSQYMLSDATYRMKYPQIAIFNTSLLQDYMHQLGYGFYKEFCFEPVLNEGLKKELKQITDKKCRKKKQIVLYGRPGTKRNAFELIVAAMRKWVWMQPDVNEWEIIAAGEKFEDVMLGNQMKIKSVGKLSIEEYAGLLKDSYAGISLMVSPHPSYPPLEMATFGVRVLTNVYANKQWESFSDYVIPLEEVTALSIAEKLVEVCNDYREEVELLTPESNYIENRDVFEFVTEIKDILQNEME